MRACNVLHAARLHANSLESLQPHSAAQHSKPSQNRLQSYLQDVGVMPAVLAAAVHAAALHNRAAHRRKREVALACQRADAVLQLQHGRGGQWRERVGAGHKGMEAKQVGNKARRRQQRCPAAGNTDLRADQQ